MEARRHPIGWLGRSSLTGAVAAPVPTAGSVDRQSKDAAESRLGVAVTAIDNAKTLLTAAKQAEDAAWVVGDRARGRRKGRSGHRRGARSDVERAGAPAAEPVPR